MVLSPASVCSALAWKTVLAFHSSIHRRDCLRVDEGLVVIIHASAEGSIRAEHLDRRCGFRLEAHRARNRILLDRLLKVLASVELLLLVIVAISALVEDVS